MIRRLLSIAAVVCFVNVSNGQSPVQLLKDINVNAEESSPIDVADLVGVNGTLFFTARNEFGVELWKSNGQPKGTKMVKDIFPGEHSDPRNLTVSNGLVFFDVEDGLHGRELHRSDGTPEGTFIIKDVRPPYRGVDMIYDLEPFDANGTVYFGAHEQYFFDPLPQNFSLWKSDGSIQGTTKVKDGFTERPGAFCWTNDILFFGSSDAEHGVGLWRSDGTAAGTSMIKDVNVATSNFSLTCGVRQLTAVGDLVFFISYEERSMLDEINLWRSDGTAEGTFIVDELSHGENPTLEYHKGKLFYFTSTGCWTSDGTVGGTRAFSGLCGESRKNFMFNKRYVQTASFEGFELWRGDGTETGDLKLTNLNTPNVVPKEMTPFKDPERTYITTSEVPNTYGKVWLWKSDGTIAGTKIIKTFSSGISDFCFVGNTLYFVGADYKLWRSDGTTDGTVPISLITSSTETGVTNQIAHNTNKLLFGAGNSLDKELWISDGTAAGTLLVKNINSSNGSFPVNITTVGDSFYFSADDGIHGRELWKSDGTEAGTSLVKDMTPGPAHSAFPFFKDFNGRLIFIMSEDLYISDGTESGTLLLRDFVSLDESTFTIVGTSLFFEGETSTQAGIWKTDGTIAGTLLVANREANELASVNDHLYFSNAEGLWRTDGTPGSATLVLARSIRELIGSNGSLFFYGCDSYGFNCGLWKSDGTEGGTSLIHADEVMDMVVPKNLIDVDGRLVFFYDYYYTVQMWGSDGTPEGTNIISQFEAPTMWYSWELDHFTVLDGGLYFFYNQAVWYTNGKTCGTIEVTERIGDITSPIHKIGNRLFFSLDVPPYGNELYYADIGWLAGDIDPVIISEPSDIELCAGESARISVRATGPDVIYEWSKDGIALNSSGPMLELSEVDEEDEGSYQVKVQSTCGSANSEVFAVSVDASVATAWFADADDDGLGNPFQSVRSCTPPVGYVDNPDDCDDTSVANSQPTLWYVDEDGDFYGTEAETLEACYLPHGYTYYNLDCDDADAQIHPDANEIIDGVDNDCDGTTDVVVVGIDEGAVDGVVVWPNPSSGKIQVSLDNSWQMESLEIQVFSVDGRNPSVSYYSNDNIVAISLETSPGLYYLIVGDGRHQIRKKVMVFR